MNAQLTYNALAKKQIAFTLSCLALLCHGVNASAASIGFDGLNGNFTGPATEDGFTFSAFSGVLFIDSGRGTPPPEMIGGLNGSGVVSFTSATPGEEFLFERMTIRELEFRTTFDTTITVEGYRNGGLVGSESHLPLQDNSGSFLGGPASTATPTGSLLGARVDELRISLPVQLDSRGFVIAAGIIDNVELTPIPEPASATLLGLSGAALYLTRRGRRG